MPKAKFTVMQNLDAGFGELSAGSVLKDSQIEQLGKSLSKAQLEHLVQSGVIKIEIPEGGEKPAEASGPGPAKPERQR
jgi:hypothetical protein